MWIAITLNRINFIYGKIFLKMWGQQQFLGIKSKIKCVQHVQHLATSREDRIACTQLQSRETHCFPNNAESIWKTVDSKKKKKDEKDKKGKKGGRRRERRKKGRPIKIRGKWAGGWRGRVARVDRVNLAPSSKYPSIDSHGRGDTEN